ncbi:MAG: Coenzyme F420 hydrogenase/dehydrogenase, beta subunit C-terminal domain [Desulfobacterales bacterium]
MQVYGSNELMEHVLKNDLCIGCGACVDLCPYFRTYKGKTAMIFPCTITKGRCHAFCPKAESDLSELSLAVYGKPYDGSPLGHYESVWVASAGETMPVGQFQAGGTVSALMTIAMKNNMIDAAVLTGRKGLIPTAELVTEADAVTRFATSKYTAAPTLSAVNRAAKKGLNRLGVVGTPCQMTALAQMSTNPFDEADFHDPVALKIGLFCTWALDTRRLTAFLKDRVDIPSIQSMDIPPPPAEILVVKTESETIEIPLDEIRLLVPGACGVCPDMTAEWADVSVGILEGEPKRNTLIVRTQTGKNLVDAAVSEGYLQLSDMPEENLEHLKSAAANKKKRAVAKALEDGLLNPENGSHAVMRIEASVVERIIA